MGIESNILEEESKGFVGIRTGSIRKGFKVLVLGVLGRCGRGSY